ncbi:hypothetical protein JW962_02700 [Candidatus Dojkabacteria bacterium]|nr:hypothetical protein [Candidatus Dojkabacteria bacterium]
MEKQKVPVIKLKDKFPGDIEPGTKILVTVNRKEVEVTLSDQDPKQRDHVIVITDRLAGDECLPRGEIGVVREVKDGDIETIFPPVYKGDKSRTYYLYPQDVFVLDGVL